MREASGLAGWMVALSSVILIPIYAAFTLYKAKGPLSKVSFLVQKVLEYPKGKNSTPIITSWYVCSYQIVFKNRDSQKTVEIFPNFVGISFGTIAYWWVFQNHTINAYFLDFLRYQQWQNLKYSQNTYSVNKAKSKYYVD